MAFAENYARRMEHRVSGGNARPVSFTGDVNVHVHMPPGSDGKEVVKTVAGIMRNTLQAQAQAVYA
jgi:hypothetical protein